MQKVEISEFKGNPTISIPLGHNGRFTFGLTKAKSILDYIIQIEDFIKANEKLLEARDLKKFMSKKEFIEYCEKNNIQGA